MKGKLAVSPIVEYVRNNCTSFDDAVEYILQATKIAQPPINVMQVAEDLGITLFDAKFNDPNLVGILVDSDTKIEPFKCKRLIATDTDSYPTRKLFTIAHEIGHYILHCSETNNYFERDHYDSLEDPRTEIERDADNFAACLLLPIKMFKQFVYKSSAYEQGDREQLIKAIMEKFLVSHTTAALRLQEADIMVGN